MQLNSRTFTALAGIINLVLGRPQFAGNFLLSDLIIDSPYQAWPNATANSTINFVFRDEDLLEEPPIRCSVEWAVGLLPPTTAKANYCQDNSVRVWFPKGTYHGIQNFTIALSHTYTDDTVGAYPYNTLTKFGEVNITFPETRYYECNIEKGHCMSCEGTSITALVTRAIA